MISPNDFFNSVKSKLGSYSSVPKKENLSFSNSRKYFKERGFLQESGQESQFVCLTFNFTTFSPNDKT